ncbi:MAG: holo-[acyl-carrier protein] synthase AcpS [Idiomarinaceae bacterium HL-53]|nr:MAG: holo-[acyl-carrier protein] synthase AcpS [Idiomarinaceae bacterium HL-53]CUS49128.1 holo-[acyl-carrier protein] synthase [Idiomarinaceae bacterium HL-53]
MSTVGIGTDIVSVTRIKAAYARQPAFAKRILTATELSEMGEIREPERFLAKRFAAKEACLKALGTGLAKGITWQDMTVTHSPHGQPLIKLSGQAAQRAEDIGVRAMHVSISDEADYAVAFVVAES